jgi:L-rhamnose-H+ transport protein
MVALGVLLHAIGGYAAGSFYIPFKKVRNWAWESYWLVGGVFSWIIMPWLLALFWVRKPISFLSGAPTGSIMHTYAFGVLWGIGGLTFGLSMRYLGMSLGYAIALGFCAAFGTLIPPIYDGTFPGLLIHTSGLVTLAGIAVCLIGIGICGWAGMSKERELSVAQKREMIREFNFSKGLLVAVFAGIMSSCMALGINAGQPIASLAVNYGVPDLWKNTPIFVVLLAGGFTTNSIWCVLLNIRNRSAADYVAAGAVPLANNYVFSALAGITWYLQFMFYGMGTTRMGKYGFSSWTLHMAFIIVFSNIWALLFREWKGSSRRTLTIITAGILVVLLSTALVGVGNYLGAQGN